jgi:KaiC/GvpD/RAD55 family RecA-like ATPase
MRRAGKMLQLSYAGQSATKLQTGFEELDKQLEGGISKKGITQILGSPGCGKTTFVHGLIKHYLDNSKQKVIYLSPTDERAVLIKRVMKV